MMPTPQLRFVEREIALHPFYKSVNGQGELTHATQKYQVLQQLWVATDEPYEEWLKIKDGVWKDVPLEKE